MSRPLSELLDERLKGQTAVLEPPKPGPSKLNALLDSKLAGDTEQVMRNKADYFVGPPKPPAEETFADPNKPFIAPIDTIPALNIPEIADPQNLTRIEVPPKKIEHPTIEKTEKPIGLRENIKREGVWGITKRLPFIGGSLEAMRNIEISKAAKRLQDNVYKQMYAQPREKWTMQMIANPHPGHLLNEDLNLVRGHFKKLEEESKRDKTFWAKVGSGTMDLAPWMIEFAATGGLSKLGSGTTRKFGEKLLGKYTATKTGQIATRGAGWLGGAAVRTTAGLPHRVAREHTERRLPENIIVDEQGKIEFQWPEESPYTSFAKAWGSTFIEAASEEAGETISAGLFKGIKKLPFGKRFMGALSRAWTKLSPDNTTTKFWREIFKKGGYSNIIGEIGEERLATIMHAIAKTQDFGLGKSADIFDRLAAGISQDIKNFPVEATVLSVPAAGRYALQTVTGKPKSPATEPIAAPERGVETRTKEAEYDSQETGRMVRPEREGQEPGRTVQEPKRGREKAEAGRVFQEPKVEPRTKAEPTPTEPVKKQPWEMTREEYERGLDVSKAGIINARTFRKERIKKLGKIYDEFAGQKTLHKMELIKAVRQNKPVPRKVLEEYKSEKWAQEALEKTEPVAEAEAKKAKSPIHTKQIAQLRRMADTLNKQIEDKRRDMTQNPTPKRMREYYSRKHDANNLERLQKAMMAMANALENGTLPVELEGVKKKDDIYSLVYKGLKGGGYYEVIPDPEYRDKSPAGKLLQKMIEEGETEEQKASRAEMERKDAITKAEEKFRFLKIKGFFPTPKPVVGEMIERADIKEGMSVLEPSASKGDIADILKEEGHSAKVIEIRPALQEILEMKGHKIVGSDFLEHDKQYDRIVMNPPFEKGQDIEHVQHAYKLLNPGGKLVSIMSEGSFSNSQKKYKEFREWFDKVGGESEKLAQAFKGKESFRQTGIPSRIVEIEKPPTKKAETTKRKGKVFYTSTPVEWHAEKDLYDWGRKGLRSRGNRKIGKRKTFVWQNEFAEIPVRLAKSTYDAIRAKTDEFFKVHVKRADDYYIAPKKVVEDLKAELGEEAFKPRPKPERSKLQLINDDINRMKRRELSDAEIGAYLEQAIENEGLTDKEITANIKTYLEVLNNEPEAEAIRQSVREGVQEAVQPSEEEIEERLGIQEQGLAEEIGDFLDGLVEKEEEKARPTEKDLFGGERPVLRGGAAGEQTEFLEKEKYKLPEPDIEGQMKLEPKPKAGKQPGYIGAERIKTELEPSKKVQSAREIIGYMERAFNIPIRGKATHRKFALGWFDPKAVGIRMKDVRSISTGAHEIAHHIDWTLNNRLSKNPPNKEIASELMKLGRALYGQTKPPGGYKSEGWAEFVREYLTGEQAKEKAPATHKWFTGTYLQSHKDVKAKLGKIKEMITVWRMQGAEARIESQISKKDFKGGLIERFERAALWLDRKWRDELAPIRYTMKMAGIEQDELTPGENPYQIAVARADKAGAVASHFVLEYTTDLAGNRTGKGLREILKPVAVDIDKFTRWIIAARARFLHKKGINSGIQPEDANYIYEKYDSPEWQEALKELTEWNHRVLDYLSEAGGLDKEAKKRIVDANPIYIPFMRAFKQGEIRFAGRGTGKGVAKTSKAIKKIKGSGREIIDPIESMINQSYKIISIAHKTQVAKALAGLTERKGTASMIWRVPAPKQATQFEAEQLKKDIIRIAQEKMGVDPGEISSAMLEHWDELLTVYSNASHYYGKDNIISLVIEGEKRFYEVHPALYRAIEGLDRYTLPWAVLAKPARMVRLGATGLNPAFGLIRNFLRDALTFTVLSKHAKAGPVSAAMGVIQDIAKTPEAQKFKALGGKMSSQILADRRALRHLKSHVLTSTALGKTTYTVAHPIDALRELFGVTEAGTRIGEFGPALKDAEKKYGKGSVDAAVYALNQAQDVTTNFSRHGEIAKVLNQIIPFFNAAIQGPDKIVRTFRARPIETTFKAIAALTIPAIWFWWKYKDKEWYKNMAKWERTSYLHFEVPGTDKIVRIPVPFELGHIFQSAPVAALDAIDKKDPKLIKEMFEESARQANPFDWPAIISPVVDILANEDFAGRPIVPMGVEYKLPKDQYKQYTTELMKIIGKTIDYSPAKIEHLVNSYSGGLYLRVAKTIELKDKKEFGLKDMPVLSTLFLKESYAPRAQLNRFYERRDFLNRKYSSDKRSLTPNERRQRKRYNSAADNLSEFWKKLPEFETEKGRAKIFVRMKRELRKARALD